MQSDVMTDTVGHCQGHASSDTVKHNQVLSGIVMHWETSMCNVKYFEALISRVNHGQVLSDTVRYC